MTRRVKLTLNFRTTGQVGDKPSLIHAFFKKQGYVRKRTDEVATNI